MNFSHKISIALSGAVAISAIAQPTPVFAISAQGQSSFVLIQTKAEDFFILGEAKYKKGDYQGALAAYSQAIVLNPNYTQAYNNRGVACRALGDKQGAVDDYNQALRINPNLEAAYNNRGIARSQLGDKQGAIADYNQALRLNPNYAEAYYNRGETSS